MVELILTLCITAAAQTANDGNAATAQEPPPTEGLWPTSTMVRHLMMRWADESGHKYEFDDDQTERLEEQLMERWPKFLNENRDTLQPLFNEFIETRLAREPPDPEKVKVWADRALPIFGDFQKQLVEMQEEMIDYMTPKQAAKLALESLKATAGLELFKAKIKSWQQGRFEEREWWDPPARVRRQRREQREREALEAAEQGPQPDESPTPTPALAKKRIEEELLRWTYYVTDFIEKYHLGDAQRDTAYSVLRECKERALAHRDRYRPRMEQLEQEMAESDTNTDELRDEINAMYAPIDEIFSELKERLDAIPTTAQTAAAEDDAANEPEP